MLHWSVDAPTTQGWYWHWDGNAESRPLPTSVIFSGTSRTCFVSAGQLGLKQAIECENYGGYWMPMIEPEFPENSREINDELKLYGLAIGAMEKVGKNKFELSALLDVNKPQTVIAFGYLRTVVQYAYECGCQDTRAAASIRNLTTGNPEVTNGTGH